MLALETQEHVEHKEAWLKFAKEADESSVGDAQCVVYVEVTLKHLVGRGVVNRGGNAVHRL